jgi:hypothetical protein
MIPRKFWGRKQLALGRVHGGQVEKALAFNVRGYVVDLHRHVMTPMTLSFFVGSTQGKAKLMRRKVDYTSGEDSGSHPIVINCW